MEYISGKFLGKPVSLPSSILSFLEYDRFSADVMSRALDLVLEKMNQCKMVSAESCLIDLENSPKPYQELLLKLSEQYITKLISFGIYDVSADSMIAKTEIYDDLDALISEVMERHMEIAKRILTSSISQLQNVYQQAGSSITGSGVSVYTSSAVTLLASGIFEGSILKSQAKRADAQFREAASAIGSQNDDAMSREDARALYNDFFPKLSSLAIICCQRLYGQFLTEMTSHGKFDFESVKQYDLSKAQQMLKNLDLVPDKQSLLFQCFQTCPYCKELYECVFEQGLLDAETFRLAENMGFAGDLEGRLAQKCRELASDDAAFENYLTVLSLSLSTDRSSALRVVYRGELSRAAESCSRMIRALESDNDMSAWLEDNADLSNANVLCSLSEQEIGEAIDKELADIRATAKSCRFGEMNLASQPDDDCMILGMGVLDKNSAQMLELSNRVLEYAARLKSHVRSCAECKERLESEIDTRKARFKKLRNELLSLVKEKKEAVKTVGIMDAKNRTRLNDEIAKLSRALDTIEMRFSLPQLRQALAEVSKEGESVEIKYLDMEPGCATQSVKDAENLVSSIINLSDIEPLLAESKSADGEGRHFQSAKKRKGIKNGDQLNLMTLGILVFVYFVTMWLITGGNVSGHLDSSAAAGTLMISYAVAAVVAMYTRSRLRVVAKDWAPDSKSSQVVRLVLVGGAFIFILVIPMLSSCS